MKYFLVTVLTCENAIYHESIMTGNMYHVSKDMVMNILEEDVPEEVMPLYYKIEELDISGIIIANDLRYFKRAEARAASKETARSR